MRRVAWIPLVLCFTFTAFAGAPALNVFSDEGKIALELSADAIRVTIRGHLARTSFELTYRQRAEGELRVQDDRDAMKRFTTSISSIAT